jgi:hypothetical protein
VRRRQAKANGDPALAAVTLPVPGERTLTIAPPERLLLSFILVKAKPGQDLRALCARIAAAAAP